MRIVHICSAIAAIVLASPCQALELLAVQDFELTPVTPTWGFTGPVIYNAGFSSATAAPPNSPIGIGGSRAWETTTNSGGLVLTFDNVILPTGTGGFVFQMSLAAMNLVSSAGGPDNLDYVLVEYSTNDGVNYFPRVRIRGATADNSFWGYNATGIASVFWQPQSESLFQPVTTGLQTTLGYSLVEISFPPDITQLRVRITGRSSSSSDTWLIDNVTLFSVPDDIFGDEFEE